MQIEFNTSRIAKPTTGQPIARQDTTTPSSTDTTSFTAAASLEASLISDPSYPSAGALDKVATLLSQNI
jgi:hypothetical protein